MDYMTMSINDIIDWCKEHGELEWLKKTAERKVNYKVYPKVVGADGKKHSDKTAKPTITKRNISFIQIKIAFCKKFMPELLPKPKKANKKSMYDVIAEL